jgi:histidyl-tRNA synthetase
VAEDSRSTARVARATTSRLTEETSVPDKLRAIRGMNDVLPADAVRWRRVENALIQILESYGYREIRLPIIEKTEVFVRSLGETTDIVGKEMYTFTDRNGEQLTLRPEATAGCVRAGLEHGLFHQQAQRLWYHGPMFRHERPQRGRYRQFHQIGVEAYGMAGPDIDAEQILIGARLWRELGLDDLTLQLNSLGEAAARERYRAQLVEYFSAHNPRLDEDSRRRLATNPLRILDSKEPAMQEIIAGAPSILDRLDPESADHFAGLRAILDAAGVAYQINPRLVRGLDYYCKTVFEWTSDRLGAQATVCAGGRYDGLVARFGGLPTPAIGFAIGLERLLALVDQTGDDGAPHVYLINAGSHAAVTALALAETLRRELPGLRVVTHCGGGSLKSQFKKADRSGALLAVILGEEELADGSAGVKPLRGTGAQIRVSRDQLAACLRDQLARLAAP